MEIEKSENISHPSFGEPVDNYVKVAFPDKQDEDREGSAPLSEEVAEITMGRTMGIICEIEISMRTHLLTLTDSMLVLPNDQMDEEENKLLADLLDYLRSCHNFCSYMLKTSKTYADKNVCRYVQQIPFLLVEDTLDTIATRHIRTIWTKYVEIKSTKEILYSPLFLGQYPKLIFIRTCNKLYKKLSSDAELSGRILP